MRRRQFPEFRDTTVVDKIYDTLERRPDGLSEQTLSRRLELSIGTIKKTLKKLEGEMVVERVMHNDQFVWRLTK
jgi:DNA-binding GntR family transcriptional regulator